MHTPVDLKELSDKAVEARNERRFDDYYGLYHGDVVYHGADGRDRRGVKELRAFYNSILSSCPDLTITSRFSAAGES